jgi:hypothetical protein
MIGVLVAGVAAVAFAGLLVAVTVGARYAHPTDLEIQRPGVLGLLARRVLGLYVSRPAASPTAANADNDERVAA